MSQSRPILFSSSMVRAILNGSKSQTRRIVRPQPDFTNGAVSDCSRVAWCSIPQLDLIDATPEEAKAAWKVAKNPYGVPGDRLWVREAWRTSVQFDTFKPSEIRHPNPPLEFLADKAEHGNFHDYTQLGRYRHARFMPRWASRLTLEITEVRVERVRDISEDDARAEGVAPSISATPDDVICESHWQSFCESWEAIHGEGSVNFNPWVWALTFRRIDQ